MTQDRTREGDWDRTEWKGEGQGDPVRDSTRDPALDPALDPADTTTGTRWNKDQYVADRGEGDEPPEDPDAMPEGETGLSGDRHVPGEQHFARGQASEDVS